MKGQVLLFIGIGYLLYVNRYCYMLTGIVICSQVSLYVNRYCYRYMLTGIVICSGIGYLLSHCLARCHTPRFCLNDC